jgi:hypothetical protein
MVPAHSITSEIRNSYICSTSGVDHSILVLHLATSGQFLSSRLTIPSSATVRTILGAVWQHWPGPAEDHLPLPSCMTLFVLHDLSAPGWFSLERLTRGQCFGDIDHRSLFLLTVGRSHSSADAQASILLRDQVVKDLIMSWWDQY